MALQNKVRSGDALRIEANTFNALLDAAQANERARRPGANPGEQRDIKQPGIILVKNVHVDVIPQYEAAGIEELSFSIVANPGGFYENPVFNVSLPTAQSEGRFVIVQEPILPGAIGRAVISGCTPARLNLSNLTDEFCDVASGSSLLHNTPVGSAQILWDQDVEGESIGFVRLWGKQYGKAFVAKVGESPISAISGDTPGSGTVTIYQLSGSSLASTGRTLTVYNMAGEVAAEAYIQVKQDAYGEWWIDVENCGE